MRLLGRPSIPDFASTLTNRSHEDPVRSMSLLELARFEFPDGMAVLELIRLANERPVHPLDLIRSKRNHSCLFYPGGSGRSGVGRRTAELWKVRSRLYPRRLMQ